MFQNIDAESLVVIYCAVTFSMKAISLSAGMDSETYSKGDKGVHGFEKRS